MDPDNSQLHGVEENILTCFFADMNPRSIVWYSAFSNYLKPRHLVTSSENSD